MVEYPTKCRKYFDCNQGAVRAVRYSTDGSYCMTAGSDKSIKLWNPKTAVLLKSYLGHSYEVLDVHGSCDNSQLISCGMDKMVIHWDVSTGKSLRKFRGHAGTVNTVAFNENSNVAISGSIDGTVKCWDLTSKVLDPIQTLTEPKDSVTCIKVTDHEIVVGCLDSKVRRYDLRNGKIVTDTLGNPVHSIAVTGDGQCILVGSASDTIKLLDKTSGELLQEFSGQKNSNKYLIDVCLTHTDKQILSGCESGNVLIWDLLEGNLIHKLKHGDDSKTVHSISQHPSRPEILSAARNFVYVWDETFEDVEKASKTDEQL